MMLHAKLKMHIMHMLRDSCFAKTPSSCASSHLPRQAYSLPLQSTIEQFLTAVLNEEIQFRDLYTYVAGCVTPVDILK